MPCLNPAPYPTPAGARLDSFLLGARGRGGGGGRGLPGARCQALFWGPSDPVAVPSFPGDQVSADAVPGTSASRNRQPHLAAGRT